MNSSAHVETIETNNYINSGALMSDLNLGDIPDLSVLEDARPEPFVDGWYQGTILGKREFVDNNGNDRVFESSDTVSQNGDSRNIRLQVEIKRRADGRTLNVTQLINYKPSDLTAETVQAVAKGVEARKANGTELGDLFRPFMTLTRLGKLQKIAGVRQFQRTAEGGLDLTPTYGKTAYFKLGPDNRNPAYKSVADFQDYEPKRVAVQ
jgi:hypothetical protein